MATMLWLCRHRVVPLWPPRHGSVATTLCLCSHHAMALWPPRHGSVLQKAGYPQRGERQEESPAWRALIELSPGRGSSVIVDWREPSPLGKPVQIGSHPPSSTLLLPEEEIIFAFICNPCQPDTRQPRCAPPLLEHHPGGKEPSGPCRARSPFPAPPARPMPSASPRGGT